MFKKSAPVYVLAFRLPPSGDLFFPEPRGFHRVAVRAGRYFYVRAQSRLPPGAEGYIFTAAGTDLHQLRRLEKNRQVRLGLYPTVEDCLAAAPDRLGERFLFGGGMPAGALLESGVLLYPLEAPQETEPELESQLKPAQPESSLRTFLTKLLGM
ncbi:MAG: hypothetical protein ACK2UW_24385 [Anaerolineales bacterium]|jgi:hypothetical protein